MHRKRDHTGKEITQEKRSHKKMDHTEKEIIQEKRSHRKRDHTGKGIAQEKGSHRKRDHTYLQLLTVTKLTNLDNLNSHLMFWYTIIVWHCVCGL